MEHGTTLPPGSSDEASARPLTEPDVEAVLQDARRATVRRLHALGASFGEVVAASRDSNADDEHDPEGATIAFERSQLDALRRRAEHRLAEVDAALVRLSEGRYGRCERCGGPVGAGRLEARPTARTCRECA